MRSFKKAILKVALFTLIFALICSPFVYTYIKKGSANNNYLPQLEAENGKIDFLICGASQSVWGFIPAVLDEELGCNSFNVSSGLLSMEGRYTILCDVLKDNPVKTLVMDFSFGNLLRADDSDTIEGELLLEEHLRGAARVRYYCTHTKLNEIFSSFYYVIRTGMYSLLRPNAGVDASAPYYGKGYWGTHEPTDQRRAIYWGGDNPEQRETSYPVDKENLLYLDKIMQLCKEKDIRVYLVTTAYPTGVVSWSNRDGMLKAHLEIAQHFGCPFYDFNLFRQKDVFFNDETSYYDVEHVSTEGAVAQTQLLSEWISDGSAGVGADARFFPSYAEMIRDYLQRHAAEQGASGS